MATPGPVTVDKMHIQVSLDNGTTFEAVACQTDMQYNPSGDTIEQDCKDTGGGAQYIEGKFRWSISGAADFAFDSTLGYKQLHDILATPGGSRNVDIKITTGSSTAGDYVIEGIVMLTGLPMTSSGGSNALVTWSMEAIGQGIPTISVIV